MIFVCLIKRYQNYWILRRIQLEPIFSELGNNLKKFGRRNMKSDDEKLKELFETKEKTTFGNPIKKARSLSIIRNVIISLMVFIILNAIALILNSTFLTNISKKEEKN